MKSIALVSLDCRTGVVCRYLRAEGNKPDKTGEARFTEWNPTIEDPEMWDRVFWWLQAYRTGYIPPEGPPPRPTNPPAVAKRAAA